MPKPMDRPFLERDDVLSWGRVVRERQYVAHPQFRDEIPGLVASPGWGSKLAIGLRRSYGDSCLNGAGSVIDATGLDRFMAYDPQTGRLRAEAGVSLSAVLQLVNSLRLVSVDDPGDPICHAWRGGRQRRSREEPPPRRRIRSPCSRDRSPSKRWSSSRLDAGERAGPIPRNHRRSRADGRHRVGRVAIGSNSKRLSRRRDFALREPRRLLGCGGGKRTGL